MEQRTVDQVLEASRADFNVSDATAAALVALVDETRNRASVSKTRGRRRVLGTLVPGILIGSLTIAGGAVAAVTSLDPQVQIPVSYITHSGQITSCMYSLNVGSVASGRNTELRQWVTSHDWSKLGQSVYDATAAVSVDTKANGGGAGQGRVPAAARREDQCVCAGAGTCRV